MANRLDSIKAIFFDVDNTLLDFTACSKTAMELAIKDFGYDSLPELYPTFRRINDALWVKIEKQEMTRTEQKNIRWKLIFGELGLSLDGKEFEKAYHRHFDSIGILIDGAKEILGYLHGRFPLYIASNADFEVQKIRLKNAGLLDYFEDIFTSERMGTPKPSGAFFENCFSFLPNISPSEVLFVGDSLEADMVGGIGFGLITCWFNFPKRAIPTDIHPDFIIDNLSDIKNMFL